MTRTLGAYRLGIDPLEGRRPYGDHGLLGCGHLFYITGDPPCLIGPRPLAFCSRPSGHEGGCRFVNLDTACRAEDRGRWRIGVDPNSERQLLDPPPRTPTDLADSSWWSEWYRPLETRPPFDRARHVATISYPDHCYEAVLKTP